MKVFKKRETVLVTGGSGYVGSLLVLRLKNIGYRVINLDTMWFGNVDHRTKNITDIRGDIRDADLLRRLMKGVDYVINLACLSNDPSATLKPSLTKEINLNAFEPMVKIAKASGVKRFINASSSSVYGVKNINRVTEDLRPDPLTDYSRYKLETERILQHYNSADFVTTSIRCATVCGYSLRQRFDVIVNLFVSQAIVKKEINVQNRKLLRPNVYIGDVVEMYAKLLKIDTNKITGQVFNFGHSNHAIGYLAELVAKTVPLIIKIKNNPTVTSDGRSYHISSDKIEKIGIRAKVPLKSAIKDLAVMFSLEKFDNALTNPKYHNIKMMQQLIGTGTL